jgi:hypothetical protein
MLKGVSLSIFLVACLALYLAVTTLFDPTLPGAASYVDSRIAYSGTVLVLGLACCVVAGFVWSSTSSLRPGTAVTVAVSLWSVLLLVVCLHLGVADQIPL